MVPFQKITEACKTTGLSQYFLRQGCKDGTIPHIKSGGVYYINVQALVEQLGQKKSSPTEHRQKLQYAEKGGKYLWTTKRRTSCVGSIPTLHH